MNNLTIFNIAIKAAIEAGEKVMEVYAGDDFHVTKKSDASPLTLADRAAHNIISGHLEKTEYPILSEEGMRIPYEERSRWTTFWLVDPLDGTKEFINRNGEFTVNIALVTDGVPVFGVVLAPVLKEVYLGIVGEGSWLLKDYAAKDDLSTIREKGIRLPVAPQEETPWRMVASRSHRNSATDNYIRMQEAKRGAVEILSIGSSLKLCMVASGAADEYPRLGPTMEWDVAAAHAVVNGAGKKVMVFGMDEEMRYNKEELVNPFFVVT